MSTASVTPVTEASGKRPWLWWLVGAVAGAGILVGVAMAARPHVYSGVVLQSPEPAPAMDPLVYENGDRVDLAALEGGVVLIYFGYTYCPDLCPTTLSTIARALEDVSDAGNVTTMMVTVDPGRDTPEVLRRYVTRFDEDFRGVWGSEQDVRSVATRYGVTFEHDEPTEDGGYLVAHTSSLMAIDREGALRVVYPVGVTADALSADIGDLLG